MSRKVLYSQRAWDQRERESRVESAYSLARSESPSEYSRRAWDSTVSLDQDPSQDRPESFAPSTNTQDYLGESTCESGDTIQSDDQHALSAGPSQLKSTMSVLGPKTRFVTRAPWEPGGEDDGQEGEEQDTPEAETRSLFGGRGRPKKSKEFPKGRQFPASFAPRASSSSRPSVDVSTPTSSSSGGKIRQTGRPGSAGTSYSNGSEALPFPSPRFERPVAPSPRHIYQDIPEQEPVSHPYANPDNASIYDNRTSTAEALSPSSIYPPTSPPVMRPPSSDPISHLPPPTSSRESPRTPTVQQTPTQQRDIPPKMSPWQYTPGSPTFQLVSLEEAQALKARQRQMSLNAAEAAPRMRTVSGPNRKSILPGEYAGAGISEDVHPSKTLKGRRSLMGLFVRGKGGDRSRPDSPPPPPVPVLSHQASPIPGNTSPLPTMQSPTPTAPLHPDSHSQFKARKISPPALDVIITSPQPQIRRQDSEPLSPPPAIPLIQKSATPPPSFPSSRTPVRKQTSATTLSPTEGRLASKPNSAPSSIQGFTSLQLRPISTMFSSMPSDYLSSSTPVPPVASYMSTSNSAGQFSTQSPTTPSLWSSRSESISTGSSEMPPFTPGGLLPSVGSISSSMDGGAQSVSYLQRQIHASKDIWKNQIADLEAQVRALKTEVAELRQSPCPSCGHFGGGSSCMEKTSIVNRPRAKTAAGTNRTLFGNAAD